MVESDALSDQIIQALSLNYMIVIHVFISIHTKNSLQFVDLVKTVDTNY